ncbi:hypothetical protein PsYK624_122980 [Phanerochaete sordida]|uniref:Uncharacterized protein n=1 Tax=Phanerochaete sordida TaxID=48140 RepID=A0A9P3GMB2_9APHY|nr:hypothetical protein PsYK624_122980 [Phanerochaete sordida]
MRLSGVPAAAVDQAAAALAALFAAYPHCAILGTRRWEYRWTSDRGTKRHTLLVSTNKAFLDARLVFKLDRRHGVRALSLAKMCLDFDLRNFAPSHWRRKEASDFQSLLRVVDDVVGQMTLKPRFNLILHMSNTSSDDKMSVKETLQSCMPRLYGLGVTVY